MTSEAEQTPISLTQMDLSVDSLIPNNYNPNEMDDKAYGRLYLVMKRLKRAPHPLWVRCLGDGKDHLKHEHEIIDGFHRWSAAKELAQKENVIIGKLMCDIYRVNDLQAMSLCYQVNTIRGVPNPFKEGLFFRQARRLASNSNMLLTYFMVPAKYMARRAQLAKIYHIYQRHAAKKNIFLGHWETMADFWNGEEDDETLDDLCLFIDESPLTVDDVENVLWQLRRNKKRTFRQLAQEILDKRKYAPPLEQKFTHTPTSTQTSASSQQTLNELEGGKKPTEAGQPETGQPPGGKPQLGAEVETQGLQPTTETIQPHVHIETAERKRVERKAWQDETPPTASHLVKCFYCKEESTINVWEEPLDVKCPNCGEEFKVMDDKGTLRSSVQQIIFRPKDRPFERIYVPKRYKDLGIDQVVKRPSPAS